MSDDRNDQLTAVHNALAGQVVSTLVMGVLGNGGGPRDILVLLESIALGVCLFLQRGNALIGEPDAVVDQLAAAVKERWAEQREQLKREIN